MSIMPILCMRRVLKEMTEEELMPASSPGGDRVYPDFGRLLLNNI